MFKKIDRASFFSRFLLSFFSLAFLWAGHLYSYQYELSMTAIFNNEGRFLKEWIEFHKLVGVQHFYLYNNRSTDNYLQILQPYIEKGEVELYDWCQDYTHLGEWNDVQCSAYQHALVVSKGKSRWLAIIDLDEFIVPVKEDNLVNLLNKYKKYSGLGVNWQMFGTSHLARIPDGQTSVEALRHKQTAYHSSHKIIKSIVQPDRVSCCVNPHWVFFNKGYTVNSDFKQCHEALSPTVCIDKVRLHHYWSRDEEYLYTVKYEHIHKYSPETSYEDIKRMTEPYNAEYDYTIGRFVPLLRQKMGY